MFERRRGVRVRQRLRRFELWSVFKLAFVFHAICGAISMGVLTLLWQLASNAGFIDRLTGFLVEIRFADDLRISGSEVFRGALTLVVGLVLHNTVVSVLLAALYNLLAGIFGGVIISVVEDQNIRVPIVAGRVAAASETRTSPERRSRRRDRGAARDQGPTTPPPRRLRRRVAAGVPAKADPGLAGRADAPGPGTPSIAPGVARSSFQGGDPDPERDFGDTDEDWLRDLDGFGAESPDPRTR